MGPASRDSRPVSSLTFSILCTAMEAAGVEVGVRLAEEGGHLIRLVDHHGCRSLELPVRRSFDAEALVICCSLALCPDGALARRWPELVALARLAVDDDHDVGVSDRGRPERLS